MSPLHHLMLAGMVTLGAWAAGAAAQDTSCEPSCPEDCVAGAKVPNPRNCAQYHTCLENCQPSDVAFDCSEGERFDVVTAECQPDDGTVTCGYCLPRCRYTCDGHEGVAADRGDCGRALLCAYNPPLIIVCSGTDAYFNGTACQDDPAQCCDPCEVFCEAPFTEIGDPSSCQHFYYCPDVGYPRPEDRFQCDSGEEFVDGHCQPLADPPKCEAVCAITTTTNSATDSTADFTTDSTIDSTSNSTTDSAPISSAYHDEPYHSYLAWVLQKLTDALMLTTSR